MLTDSLSEEKLERQNGENRHFSKSLTSEMGLLIYRQQISKFEMVLNGYEEKFLTVWLAKNLADGRFMRICKKFGREARSNFWSPIFFGLIGIPELLAKN